MAFQVAISGLRAAQSDLDVLGNNIANSGTTGFKGSTTEFRDVYAVTQTGIASNQIGNGVNTSRVSQGFGQGSLDFTNNNMDLAITGGGFFVVDHGGAQQVTRNGSFGLDANRNVVNTRGDKLVAFGVDALANVTGQVAPLQISNADNAPKATTKMDVGLNLDATALPPVASPFDKIDPTSYNNSTSTSVYDSLGNQHLAEIYYVNTAPNAWDTFVFVDGQPYGGQPDVIDFDSVGALQTPASPGIITVSGITPGSVDPITGVFTANAANPMDIDFNYTGTTQYGAPFGVNQLHQDGYTTGRLAGVDIGADGRVLARFTNGQTRLQGQVAIASFANPQGLTPAGDTNWTESAGSGAVLLGIPGSGGNGIVQSGALEQANVDIAAQLVKLIVAQRNFQANTQVIKTNDQVTQSIINIR
jgi:flagellar hook protein FlgE